MSRDAAMSSRERDVESGDVEVRPLLSSAPAPPLDPAPAPPAPAPPPPNRSSLAAFFFPTAGSGQRDEVTPLLSLLALPPAPGAPAASTLDTPHKHLHSPPAAEPSPTPSSSSALPLPAPASASTEPAATAAAPGAREETPEPLRCCRFCLGEEGEDPELGPLFTPCLCRDTVHHVCLRRWRATNSTAFYTCNVCKWDYQFKRLSPWSEFGIRLLVVLFPIFSLLALCMLLGFIPVFPSGGDDDDIVVHLQNGAASLGLLYLLLLVTAFNLQYCRLTVIAARSAAATLGLAALPLQFQVQLVGYVVARCLVVGMFFGFCMVYFFPYSGFMGFIALILTSPAGFKALADRLIRRAEFDQPVKEVTAAMATQAAADQAAKAAELAEAARLQRDDVSDVDEELGADLARPHPPPAPPAAQQASPAAVHRVETAPAALVPEPHLPQQPPAPQQVVVVCHT